MKHKIEQLQNLVRQMGDRSSLKMKSMKKPVVSIHVEKHEDEYPEEQLMHEKMESPLDEKKEDSLTSDSSDFLKRLRK